MTIVDSSLAIDFLAAEGAVDELDRLLADGGELPACAPDVLVAEVLAVFRREARRGTISIDRAGAAVSDLGDLQLDLFPSLPLRERAWELRDNFTAADALFVALAERLGEPLATKDRHLARAARRIVGIETIDLAG